MLTRRRARGALLALAGAVTVCAAALGVGMAPASALPAGSCLLPGILCPTTTLPKPPPTTKPPVTTTPPTTAHTTTPTTARKAPAPAPAPKAPTSASRNGATARVGAPGLRVSGQVTVPPLNANDPAPELAGTPAPDPATPALAPVPVGLPGGGLTPGVVATTGLPSTHAALRVALGLLALVVAVVALVQLSPSRRRPQPVEPPAV